MAADLENERRQHAALKADYAKDVAEFTAWRQGDRLDRDTAISRAQQAEAERDAWKSRAEAHVAYAERVDATVDGYKERADVAERGFDSALNERDAARILADVAVRKTVAAWAERDRLSAEANQRLRAKMTQAICLHDYAGHLCAKCGFNGY